MGNPNVLGVDEKDIPATALTLRGPEFMDLVVKDSQFGKPGSLDGMVLSPGGERVLAKLRKLDFPVGRPDMVDALAADVITEERRFCVERGMRLQTLAGIGSTGPGVNHMVSAEQEMSLARMHSLMLGKDAEEAVLATIVMLENLERLPDDLSKAAFLRLMMTRLGEAHEKKLPAQREVIKWRAAGAPEEAEDMLDEIWKEMVFIWRRVGDLIKGKSDEKPPFLTNVYSVLNIKMREVATGATYEYLSKASSLEELADLYTKLVYSGCDPLGFDMKVKATVRVLFETDAELAQKTAVYKEIVEWFSEDFHAFLRRLAQGYYKEIDEVSKYKVYRALMDMVERLGGENRGYRDRALLGS